MICCWLEVKVTVCAQWDATGDQNRLPGALTSGINPRPKAPHCQPRVSQQPASAASSLESENATLRARLVKVEAKVCPVSPCCIDLCTEKTLLSLESRRLVMGQHCAALLTPQITCALLACHGMRILMPFKALLPESRLGFRCQAMCLMFKTAF